MLKLRVQDKLESHLAKRLHEWVLSLTLLGFGAQLLLQQDSWAQSKAYIKIEQVLSQQTWGQLALGVAVVWIVSLTINGVLPGTRRWTPVSRLGCSISAAGFWGVQALVYVIYTPAHPGLVNNLGFMGMALAASIGIVREVGVLAGKACHGPRR